MQREFSALASWSKPNDKPRAARTVQQGAVLFLLGAALYFPIAANRLANPDVFLNGLTSYKSGVWEISLGRFGLYVYDRLRGGVIVPALTTFFCVLLMTLSALLIARALRANGWQTLFVGAVLLLSPTFMNTLTYYYCSGPYLMAMLIAVVAAVVLRPLLEARAGVRQGAPPTQSSAPPVSKMSAVLAQVKAEHPHSEAAHGANDISLQKELDHILAELDAPAKDKAAQAAPHEAQGTVQPTSVAEQTAPPQKKLAWLRGRAFLVPAGRVLLGAACVAVSLSVYQAYFFVTVTLCVIFAVCALLHESTQVRRVVRGLCLQACACLGGLLLYNAANAAVQRAFDIVPGAARFGGTLSVSQLPALAGAAYHNFLDYFFTNALLDNGAYRRAFVNFALFALMLGALALVIWQRRLWRSPVRCVCLLALLAALPVTCMGITLAGAQYSLTQEATGVLTVPAMPLVYVLAAAVWGKVRFERQARPVRVAMPVCGAALLLVLVCYAGVFQNRLQENAQRYTAAAQLVTQALTQEYGSLANQTVMLVGTLNGTSNFPDLHPELSIPTQWTLANYGMVWDSLQGQVQGWPAFFREYMGVSYRPCTQEEFLAFAETGRTATMELFPDKGSVVRWNDILVVYMGRA